VLRGDVVDELQHGHRLAHAGAAEEANLAALGERADQVDHLDAGLEQLDRRRELVELGRGRVDRAALLRVDRSALVDRAAENVHHAPQRGGAHRHRNGRSGVRHLHPATQAVGRAHRDGAHDAIAQLLLHFEGQVLLGEGLGAVFDELQRVVDLRHVVARKLDVDHRADALDDPAFCHLGRAHGFPVL
jgi:peptide chain release factor 1